MEHTVLFILGQAFLAWDMPHLTDIERTYRIEVCEAILVYSLGGEQLYLPFSNGACARIRLPLAAWL